MPDKKDIKGMHEEFQKRFQGMLDLVARGRGIEILIRIVDQTQEGLKKTKEYGQMMKSELKIPNLHPPQSLPKIFKDTEERKRLELAREIADKLAHALYLQARKLIDKYHEKYLLKTELNSESFPGWSIRAEGHIIEDDGRRVDTVIDSLKSSKDNLIVEEYDVFVHNNYHKASQEIFDDAWIRISTAQKSLAIESFKLHMLRGFRRGERTYIDEKKLK